MAYFRDKFSLCLKGRLYAIVAFMYLMGRFYAKQAMHVCYAYAYIKGKFYAMGCFVA